jgi:DNA-binding CsgD family transcriptional regulator
VSDHRLLALPARYRTPSFGREALVSEIIQRSAPSSLVGLSGPPAAGKTRLALEAAFSYATEVHWCDTRVLSPDEIQTAIAAAQGVLVVEADEANDALLAMCHRALERTPDLTVHVTCQHWPEHRREPVVTAGGLSSDEAMHLYIERRARAGALHPLSDDAAVEAICNALDHLPGLVELAAIAGATITETNLAHHLRRFNAITSFVPARWTSDWLLALSRNWPDRDRATLEALTVFGGSFSLEAASAVLGGDELEALDALSRLAAWQIVRIDHVRHAGYRLLGHVRALGAEFADPSRLEMVRTRALEWLMRTSADEGREALTLEIEDQVALGDWLLERRDYPAVLSLAEVRSSALAHAGEAHALGRWLSVLLEEGRWHEPDRGRVLSQLCFALAWQGEWSRAAYLAAEGLASARRRGDGPSEDEFAFYIERFRRIKGQAQAGDANLVVHGDAARLALQQAEAALQSDRETLRALALDALRIAARTTAPSDLRASLDGARQLTVPLVSAFRVRLVDSSAPESIQPLESKDIPLAEALTQGLSNRGIADRLGLSEPVVRHRLSRLYKRYQCTTRAQMVRLILERGLLSEERS